MRKILDAIKNFFNQPDRMEEIEIRFYKRLEDMEKNPEKYKHIKPGNSSKIPPVSLF